MRDYITPAQRLSCIKRNTFLLDLGIVTFFAGVFALMTFIGLLP